MLRQALARRHQLFVATESVRPASWRYARAVVRAAGQLRRRPDLVLAGFYAQPLMPLLRALTRRPLLLDAYVSTYDTLCFDRRRFRPHSLPGRLAYALDLWSCRWADHVLFDTAAHRDYFVETFGLSPSKTSVVYVGCDEAHFVPRLAPRTDGPLDVFTYTSFLDLHGVEHILRAAHLLAGQADVRFTIAGSGRRLEAMRQLARDLDLPNVDLPGWLPFDQLPERIARADICLGGHFSDIAKAGRVIATKTFQFLAMAKPVIVGDNPASREVMVHGEHAYLCSMADPASLADAVVRLRDDAALRRQLSEGGRALFCERFTVEATALALQEALDRMLG
jgi:glycosyltransferase involved in cell wall biosynthesis